MLIAIRRSVCRFTAIAWTLSSVRIGLVLGRGWIGIRPSWPCSALGGRRVAVVTVGPRSGCYLVCLRGGSDPRVVRGEYPELVVELILAARPGVRS